VAGIRHRYEELDDNHADIDYRMDFQPPVPLSAVEAMRHNKR
jgi:hypothetical protein